MSGLPRKIPKAYRAAPRATLRAGWRIERTTRHLAWTSPTGNRVITHPHGDRRAYRNSLARLRSAGLLALLAGKLPRPVAPGTPDEQPPRSDRRSGRRCAGLPVARPTRPPGCPRPAARWACGPGGRAFRRCCSGPSGVAAARGSTATGTPSCTAPARPVPHRRLRAMRRLGGRSLHARPALLRRQPRCVPSSRLGVCNDCASELNIAA